LFKIVDGFQNMDIFMLEIVVPK